MIEPETEVAKNPESTNEAIVNAASFDPIEPEVTKINTQTECSKDKRMPELSKTNESVEENISTSEGNGEGGMDEEHSRHGASEAAGKIEDEDENTNNHNGGEIPKETSSTPDEPKTTSPRKQRNSLIDRVKTVTEDGETDLEDEENKAEKKTNQDDEDPWVISDSNLRDPQRRICVVTTAALPWRTGTAVNPLLRALYLTRGRPKHHVTLVIPWCDKEDDRKKTLGREHSFSNQSEQEEWIRHFCRTRANCEEEERNLKIMFYPSKYNEGFGSIFPAVDICSFIPDDEADVAILEEPEHLNWLRIPPPYKEETNIENEESKKTDKNGKREATAKEKAELGWRFKFRHVVGIVHTNYKAYAEQYGVGAAFITAPALCALNALVVRAYCHRVILLSGTLPSLTPYKEVTCNVHGVRGEFLDRPSKSSSEDEKAETVEEDEKHASVYFIGKLIWAKGFDKILDLQNLYREKHDGYFPIDVYGAGGDAKAIKRAFFGRIPQIQKGESSDDERASIPDSGTAEVFTWETSLRSHLIEEVQFKDGEKHECLDDLLKKRRSSITPSESETQEPPASPKKPKSMLEDLAGNVLPISVLGNLSLSAVETTKETAGAAVAMAKSVVGAGLNVAFTNDVGSPKRSSRSAGSEDQTTKRKLIFDPPKSIFEFRRTPIQARFLGTKDHVEIRDIAEQKVFLNMSITEVLCTTSAEALAMGKFVILPKHPSNMFFLQFPNCLAYTSLDDCVSKLAWALANDPVPLDEETAMKLSWEGANERLFGSSAITRDEWEEWIETKKLDSDDDAARFHVETGMKGQLITHFFTGEKKSKEDKPVDS